MPGYLLAEMVNVIKSLPPVGKSEVSLPFSNLTLKVAKVLEEAGYVKGAHPFKEGTHKRLGFEIVLEDSLPLFEDLKVVSKPGRRVYARSSEIPVLRGGRGLVIVSTSRGVMTGEKAKRQRLGGEILMEVW